ncbi:MAG: ATP-dependent DNA ligase [Actinobacteria bacterium]|nr:ATP-dependent DNA ligase [Actinomycetota bacterium]
MGTLIYGSGALKVEFDDRVLAHLQTVVGIKVRRNERFFLSWFDTQAVGDGRSAVWIAPEVPLAFQFTTVSPHKLNRPWVESMIVAAGSSAGLVLTQEPDTGEPVVSDDNTIKRKERD